jgi:tetratricopeptide (TPR) repeat protein
MVAFRECCGRFTRKITRWPRPRPADTPATITLTALHHYQGRNLDRRNFALVTGSALAGTLLAWLAADPAAAGQLTRGRRIGEAAVSHVERRVGELRHADDNDGGGQVRAEATASLAMVISLLKDRSCTSAHSIRLYAAAADLARMRAWAAFDVHGTCADGTFAGALRAAHAAGDPALGAHVLSFWAAAAYNTGRPADAEAMTAAALAATRSQATPRVQAMLHSRRARARAHLRDTACWADLGRASKLLDACGPSDEDPGWVYWFDRAELLGATASTHLDFGRPRSAEQAFVQAAGMFPPGRVRTHALYLARQADAQWSQDEPERACDTARRALDLTAGISSHRSSGPLRDLAARMADHDHIPAVREYRERAAAVLTAA